MLWQGLIKRRNNNYMKFKKIKKYPQWISKFCNSKKHIFVLIILFCFKASLFAIDFLPNGGFAGLGPEINEDSRAGISLGGILLFGIDLNDYFSLGLKTALFDNFDTLCSYETSLFFRYYLPGLHLPKSTDGPFVQAEAGGMVFFERGYHRFLEAFPAFSGGLSAGWRFTLGKRWYVEPAARFGYPHIWGLNVMAGFRFKTEQKIIVIEQKKEEEIIEQIIDEEKIEEPIYEESEEEIPDEIIEETIEEIEEDEIKIVQDNDGNLRIQVFSIIFRADHADFNGLSDEIIENNYAAIKRVAELLTKYKNYRVIIEGHANPTKPEGPAREQERYSLTRLSEQRALKVLEELVALGVSYDRMTVLGAGFSGIIAPYNDYENVWKNRRVEFILIVE
jgi:outer membrane protein OmpA-like peptidoglycan-associated protein